MDDGVTDRDPTGVGRSDAEDCRRPSEASALSGEGGRGLRFLPTGKAGNGPVGGASGGREGRCMVEVIVPAGDMTFCWSSTESPLAICYHAASASPHRHEAILISKRMLQCY